MADKTGYIGRNPGDSSVTIARQTFTPTSNTTDFTFNSGYTVGLCDVYLNGVKLVDTRDYEANTGTTVGLTSEAISGDIVEIVAYKAFNISNVTNANGNFTVAGNTTLSGTVSVASTATLSGVTTCEGDLYVGGDLYVLDDIVYDEVTGRNLNITGVATAATIHVGSATTIDGSGVNVTGVVTATTFKGDGSALTGVAATDNINTNNIKVSGISTLGHATGTELKITGISTFQNTVSLPDDKSILLGDDDDLEIHHAAGANSYIKNNTLSLDIRSDTTNINSKNNAVTFVKSNASGVMATTGVGTVTRLYSTDVNVTGVVTATSYKGDGSALTGIAATSNINTNNIQVSGITTFQSLQEPFDFWMFAG